MESKARFFFVAHFILQGSGYIASTGSHGSSGFTKRVQMANPDLRSDQKNRYHLQNSGFRRGGGMYLAQV